MQPARSNSGAMILRFLSKRLTVVVLALVLISESQPCPVPNIRDKGNEKKVVDVIAGKDVRLTCQVKENGVNTSWLKNNKTFSPSVHPRMRLKLNNYLKIKRVQKDDAGFYTCVAENDCGKNTYTVQLSVGSPTQNPNRNSMPVPPQLKQSSPPRVVKPVGEEEVKLVCNVKDAQNYTWYKNGKTILQPSRRYTVKSYRFLGITDRVKKSDSGVFVCVAKNNYGSINCTVRLIVEDPAVSPTNITGEKPQFLYPTRMESIKSTYKEGDKFTLTCEARGIPAPVVTWYKNDKIFYGRHRAGEVIETGKYDYIINFVGVDIADEGNYTCIVSNMFGQLTYSYNFDVIEKVRSVPQILRIWEQEKPVYAGSNLELFCSVLTKDPNTRYRWYYRDSDVPEVTKLGTLLNQSLYKLTPSQNHGSDWPKWKLKLHLKNASVADSGIYGCQAENVLGNGSRQTYLNVTIRPITPTATDKQEQNISQKHGNATDGEKSPWTNRIKHLDILIGILAGVIVLAIIAAGVCYWQVKKACASSSTAKSRRPEIDSLRAKHEVQNEYVVVSDYNRNA